MQQPSLSSPIAPIAHASPQRLRFGFPRAYVVTQLRARLVQLLQLDDHACEQGYLDDLGHFVALDVAGSHDDFDGPDFALKLQAHVISLRVSILYGSYRLQVQGHEVEIAFLPTLDEARLVTAARWIIHHLEGTARLR